MLESFPPRKINRLKRQAQWTSNSSGIELSEVLDSVAVQKGFFCWSHLVSTVQQGDAPVLPAVAGSLKQFWTRTGWVHLDETALATAFYSHIANVRNSDIYCYCCNGSVWLNTDCLLSKSITAASFVSLGPKSDNYTRRTAEKMGVILFLDCDGLADSIVFSDDVDEDGSPVVPEKDQLHYTAETARRRILSGAGEVWGSLVDSLLNELEYRYDIEINKETDYR